jgi:hypothetical protein
MFQSSLFDTADVEHRAHTRHDWLFDTPSQLANHRFVTTIGKGEKAQVRHLCQGDSVDAYRNLCLDNQFSIKMRHGEWQGKVCGYAQAVIIRHPEFVISEAGRKRILASKQKNVHAYVRGIFYDAFEGNVRVDQGGIPL